MVQSSRNQPPKQTILAKCRPSRWNGSPAFKTPLANKWRKGITTSSLIISFSLYTLEKGEPIPTATISRNVCSSSERNASVHAMFDTQYALLSLFPIVLFVTTTTHRTASCSLTVQSSSHNFKPLPFSSTLFEKKKRYIWEMAKKVTNVSRFYLSNFRRF